eukprot:CAMPEP_0184312260 /NCGR_PEP_ID=MMETSP1049-20130417/48467_1 /TAXON_ID=77928 /ORGANISM="Proteomonas sulcata, Strain CCMP704" /LENGTH=67 /DNA_ID=CAMNT_0026628257 /DNA_START=98 /DNA_END=298 /DNA_ORIENTATION=-
MIAGILPGDTGDLVVLDWRAQGLPISVGEEAAVGGRGKLGPEVTRSQKSVDLVMSHPGGEEGHAGSS